MVGGFIVADNRSSARSRLTPEQFDALKREAENYKQAQRQFAEALGVLWSAQINAIAATGQADLLEKVLGRPLGLWDDCSCCS